MKKITLLILFFVISLTGCTSINNNETRVVVGDTVSLNIMYEFDIEVVGVPDNAIEVHEKYSNITKVGNAMGLKNEEIYMLDPSVVIMSNSTEEAFGNVETPLNNLGINTKFMDYDSIINLKKSIVELGDYFDKSDVAYQLIQKLELGETDIISQVQALEYTPKVLVLFGAPMGSASDSISVQTNYMFGGSIIDFLGGINVGSSAYPNDKRGMYKPNDWEPLYDENPDYIFCIAHGYPDEVFLMYDTIWETLPYSYFDAVQNNNVYYLPSDIVNVIATFDYNDSLQYILDIFNGKIDPYYNNGLVQ